MLKSPGSQQAARLLMSAPRKVKRGDPPQKELTSDEAQHAVSYLDIFGYLPKALDGWKDITIADITKALGLFQSWFGVERTKSADTRTLRAMNQPRCGMPDIIRDDDVRSARMASFIAANLPRWQKDGLVYSVAKHLPGLSTSDQDKIFQTAFDAWAQYGNIDVARNDSGSADIIITYGEGAASNFDGPGGVLAWAYMPTGNDSQLEMRFDLSETWIIDPQQRGILLLNVATHEFGHLYGLDHSKLQSALMAPYYNVNIRAPQQDDDIPRFQARYGVRTTKPPVVPASATAKVEISGNATVWLNGKQLA